MRVSGAARVALGGLLLSRPAALAHLAESRPSGKVLPAMRLLGGRYLVQGTVDLVLPHDRRIDAGVEVLHAASMLPLAWRSRRHARLALLSAGVAATLAAADLAEMRSMATALIKGDTSRRGVITEGITTTAQELIP